MDPLLTVGIVLALGLLLGEVAQRLGFPRVAGYIVAGILLNPKITGVVPADFVSGTDPIVNAALAIITFEVGGTLAIGPLRELGRGIVFLALGEAELAALAILTGSILVLPFLVHLPTGTGFAAAIPLALLLGALGSPTDPSATLAVIHQYRAKGMVSFSIMGAAAFDDALGIINFSIATALAGILVSHSGASAFTFLEPFLVILGSVALGVALGFLYHGVVRLLGRSEDGILIALAITILLLGYGVASVLKFDQLLVTMAVGITVVNVRRTRPRIFQLLERHIEPLVFLLFFTLSGMYLDFGVLIRNLPVVLLFVVFRTVGKLSGAYLGASLGRAPHPVRRYTGWGLIPQGGIVIGLALTLKGIPELAPFADILVNVIIGATVIHELIGPFTAKFALQQAGEIPKGKT
ncbi:MAG TPA: sodium:proton exchanger [Candidatus Acetothermia bacterium]|nr:sodium:proton exchanger [Candidatus Acetothermia bacterium]